MSELVRELKQEHLVITYMLEELQKDITKSSKSLDLLIRSKKILLAHLKKEDEQLYPPLHEKAKSDAYLKKTLDTFGAEMEKITEFVLGFYEKYSNAEDIKRDDFRKDISTFILTLKGRVMKEEVAIYKTYENLKMD